MYARPAVTGAWANAKEECVDERNMYGCHVEVNPRKVGFAVGVSVVWLMCVFEKVKVL